MATVPPTSSAPVSTPIVAETITPGPLRLKDIVRCIPLVELNPRSATGVPNTRKQGLALARKGKGGVVAKPTRYICASSEECLALAHIFAGNAIAARALRGDSPEFQHDST